MNEHLDSMSGPSSSPPSTPPLPVVAGEIVSIATNANKTNEKEHDLLNIENKNEDLPTLKIKYNERETTVEKPENLIIINSKSITEYLNSGYNKMKFSDDKDKVNHCIDKYIDKLNLSETITENNDKPIDTRNAEIAETGASKGSGVEIDELPVNALTSGNITVSPAIVIQQPVFGKEKAKQRLKALGNQKKIQMESKNAPTTPTTKKILDTSSSGGVGSGSSSKKDKKPITPYEQAQLTKNEIEKMKKHEDRALPCFYYDKTMIHHIQADSEFKTIPTTKSNLNVTPSLEALKCYEDNDEEERMAARRKLHFNKNNNSSSSSSSFREKFNFKTDKSKLPKEYRSDKRREYRNRRKDRYRSTESVAFKSGYLKKQNLIYSKGFMYTKSKPILSYTFSPRIYDNDCKTDEKGPSSTSSKSKRLKKKRRVSVANEDTIPITPPAAGIETEERQSKKSKSKERSKLRNPSKKKSKKKSGKSDGKKKKRKRRSTLILQPPFPTDDLSFEEDFDEFPLSKDCVSGAGPTLITENVINDPESDSTNIIKGVNSEENRTKFRCISPDQEKIGKNIVSDVKLNKIEPNDSPDTDDYMPNWEDEDSAFAILSRDDNVSYENHNISIEQLNDDCTILTNPKHGEDHDDDKGVDSDGTPIAIKDGFSTPIFVNPSPPEEVILSALVAQSAAASVAHGTGGILAPNKHSDSINTVSKKIEYSYDDDFNKDDKFNDDDNDKTPTPVLGSQLFGMQVIYEQFMQSVKDDAGFCISNDVANVSTDSGIKDDEILPRPTRTSSNLSSHSNYTSDSSTSSATTSSSSSTSSTTSSTANSPYYDNDGNKLEINKKLFNNEIELLSTLADGENLPDGLTQDDIKKIQSLYKRMNMMKVIIKQNVSMDDEDRQCLLGLGKLMKAEKRLLMRNKAIKKIVKKTLNLSEEDDDDDEDDDNENNADLATDNNKVKFVIHEKDVLNNEPKLVEDEKNSSAQEKLINHEESDNGNSSNIFDTNRETIKLTISPSVKKTTPKKSTSLKEPIDSDCDDQDFTEKLLKLPKENRATSKNEKTSSDGSRRSQSRSPPPYSKKDTDNISRRKSRLKNRSISPISPQRKESNDVESSDSHPKSRRRDRRSMYSPSPKRKSGSPNSSFKSRKLSRHDKHFARTASKNISEREERYSLSPTQSSRRRSSPRSPYFSASSGCSSGRAVHNASPPYRSNSRVSLRNTGSLSPEQRGKGSKSRCDASFGKSSKTDNYNESINRQLPSTSSAGRGDLRITDGSAADWTIRPPPAGYYGQENYYYPSSPNRISLDERISLVLNENPDHQQQTNAQAAPIRGGGGYPSSYHSYSEYNMYTNEYMNPPPGYANSGNYGNEYVNTDNLSNYSRIPVVDLSNNYYYNQQFLNHPESMQLHQQQQHQHQEALPTNSNNNKILQHDDKSGKSSTFAVQKGNVLEIVPAPVVPKLEPESPPQSIMSKEPDTSQWLEDIKPTLNEGVVVSATTETKKCKKRRRRTTIEDSVPWEDEVAKRHIMSAVMRLNKEENGSPRGILVTKTSATAREKKKVLFADGIPPGKASSASDDDEYVNVRTVRKRSKKKRSRGENKENENLLQDGAADVNNIEIKIDRELENAPPPPPPPGSPPANLLQPRPNRPPSPPQLLYFHYDPVVNSMYVSQLARAIPPRLLNKNNPAPVPPVVPPTQQQNPNKSPNNVKTQINNNGTGSDSNTGQSIRPNSPVLSITTPISLSSTNSPNQDQDQPIAKIDKSDSMALPQPTTGPGNSFSETQLCSLANGGQQDINKLSTTSIGASTSSHHATQNLTSGRLTGDSGTNFAHPPPSLDHGSSCNNNNNNNTNNENTSSGAMLCSSSRFPPTNAGLNFNTQSRLMANSPSTCGIRPTQFCIPPPVSQMQNINASSPAPSHNPNNLHRHNLQLLRATSPALPNTNRPANFRSNMQYNNLPGGPPPPPASFHTPPHQSQPLDNCNLQQHFSHMNGQLGHGPPAPNHSYHNQDTQFADNSVKYPPAFSPNDHHSHPHSLQYNSCGVGNVGGGQYPYNYNDRHNAIEPANHHQCFNIGPGQQYSKKFVDTNYNNNARAVGGCPTFGMVSGGGGGGVKNHPNVNPGGSGGPLPTVPHFNPKDCPPQFNANGSKRCNSPYYPSNNCPVPPHVRPNLCNATNVRNFNVMPPYNMMGQQQVRPPPPHPQCANSTGPTSSYHSPQVANFSVRPPIQTPPQSGGGVHQLFLRKCDNINIERVSSPRYAANSPVPPQPVVSPPVFRLPPPPKGN